MQTKYEWCLNSWLLWQWSYKMFNACWRRVERPSEGPNTSSVWIWHKSVHTQTKLEAKDVLPNINRTQATERAKKCCFFCPGDLDLQTRPSDGPNMSYMWIWRKAIQWFPRYFIHKKTNWRHQKQNFLQFTVCGKNSDGQRSQYTENLMTECVMQEGCYGP